MPLAFIQLCYARLPVILRSNGKRVPLSDSLAPQALQITRPRKIRALLPETHKRSPLVLQLSRQQPSSHFLPQRISVNSPIERTIFAQLPCPTESSFNHTKCSATLSVAFSKPILPPRRRGARTRGWLDTVLITVTRTWLHAATEEPRGAAAAKGRGTETRKR